jgi:crotonobetaine/carnitine-CoA ligase
MRDNAMPDALPDANACVIRYILDRRATERPDHILGVFTNDDPWTWGQAVADVRALAALLRRSGVRQGDRVATWLPNGRDAVTAWFAINYIGAVYAPLNIAYRARSLAHGLQLSGATVMIAHPDLVARLGEIDPTALTSLIVDRDIAAPHGLGVEAWPRGTVGETSDLPLDRPIAAHDLASIILTSGTTGPSKGVEVTYAQSWFSATGHPIPQSDRDRGLVQAPLFHVSGMGPVMRALVAGGSFAVLERFNTRTFWEDVRALGATTATVMSSMASFLLSAPQSEAERETTLTTMLVAPLTPDTIALATRAGVSHYTVFSMSETALPITSEMSPTKIGVCGRPRGGITARIVDANDIEVPRGTTGELTLRSDQPWAISAAFFGDDGATARAWRNGWFHTGDAFRIDEDGDYQFVDRIKDAIRRRGENISSYEVEAEVTAHADVADCAAIAVPSEHGEDEVMIVVETVAGAAVTAEALLTFLRPRMPHFMLPRYIRFMPSIPRTPTEKIQKQMLRDDGVTADTWDRDRAGIKVTSERLS